jgi:hypothetical protein
MKLSWNTARRDDADDEQRHEGDRRTCGHPEEAVATQEHVEEVPPGFDPDASQEQHDAELSQRGIRRGWHVPDDGADAAEQDRDAAPSGSSASKAGAQEPKSGGEVAEDPA